VATSTKLMLAARFFHIASGVFAEKNERENNKKALTKS
jgi:hypothetical protein